MKREKQLETMDVVSTKGRQIENHGRDDKENAVRTRERTERKEQPSKLRRVTQHHRNRSAEEHKRRESLMSAQRIHTSNIKKNIVIKMPANQRGRTKT